MKRNPSVPARFVAARTVVVAIFVGCVGFVIGGSGPIESYAGSRPVARSPTAAERGWVATLMDDLAANADAMPIPVVNASISLTKTLNWSFSCPPGSRLREIEMLVSTELVHWDPHLAGRHKTAGTYYWGVKLYSLGEKATVTADNWVMLDSKILDRQARRGRTGDLVNQGLLYHELLHGELMILAMATREWQTKACNLELDLRRNDQDHHTIDPAVKRYLDALAGAD